MKYSPQRNQNKASRSARPAPYRCPLSRCTRVEEDIDIIRMASRRAKPTSLIKRTAPANLGNSDRKSSLDSISSVTTSRSIVEYRNQNNRYNKHSSRKDTPRKVNPKPKGNHYFLGKIVDYLLTHTLASYFRNIPIEDRQSTSGFANVTKFLMGASVVHLGGKHNLYSHSYLKSLRKGLSHASRHHEFQEAWRRENRMQIEGFLNDVGFDCGDSDNDMSRSKRKRLSGNPKMQTRSKTFKSNHKNQKRSTKFKGNYKNRASFKKVKGNYSRSSRRMVDTDRRKEIRNVIFWFLKDMTDEKRTTRNSVKHTSKSSSKKCKRNDKENEERRGENWQKLAKPNSRDFEVRLCNFDDLKNRKLLRQSLYSDVHTRRSDTDTRSEISSATSIEPDKSIRRVPSLTRISGV